MKLLYVVFFSLVFSVALAQSADSTKNISSFSGSVGFTNNGFSIIPTFSLNHAAFVTNLSFRKKRFSFDPDIRLVPDAQKGGLIWWLRYRLVDNKKFGLRVGTHPAFTLIRRDDTENGTTKEITEMLRFLAFEVVPSYQFNNKFGVSAMYLQGNGLQKHGPQLTRVLFLNTSITNVGLGKNLSFNLFPSVYFLYTDGYRGDYLTVTGALFHKKLPFSLQSTINQTFTSNVPGNKDFMWNITLNYNFKKIYKKIN
ncbi:hypothetical protein GCM10011514_36750 [Emticicia aquatilis]|uniref:DUF2490 domain-containing protein n=1 Tax=Emticicia aquatilis TaxID=1537369 RepID=A0A917DUU1_9BACT|nr:hypothetical protein [Emticicia aquatilis]GGD69284.1 hypothetical protein GCM10011514_36750 [Emticicia aquatilis]